MRGKKAGTPNYKKDLLVDIVDKKRPKSLADWNDVAATYHLRSKELELRKGVTIQQYFFNFLCRTKRYSRCLELREQICGPEVSYMKESDDDGDESSGDDDDDDDDDESYDDGNNVKVAAVKTVDVDEDDDDDDDDEEDKHEPEPPVDTNALLQQPQLNPEPPANTNTLLQQLNRTVETISTRIGQAPEQASMPQTLAMFALHTQIQDQAQEKLLEDMENRWQQKFQKQEKLRRNIQDHVKDMEWQVYQAFKKVDKTLNRRNNERSSMTNTTSKKRKRSQK